MQSDLTFAFPKKRSWGGMKSAKDKLPETKHFTVFTPFRLKESVSRAIHYITMKENYSFSQHSVALPCRLVKFTQEIPSFIWNSHSMCIEEKQK